MTTEENYRDVQDTKISESYKGILRITNVSDVAPSDDTYDNTNLYSLDEVDTNPYLIDGFIYSTPVLNGKSKRYKSDDELKSNRIPVTDSFGNYLNWNINKQGLTIGSNIFDSKESLVLETKTIESKSAELSDIVIDMNSYKLQFKPTETLKNNSVLIVKKDDEAYTITTANLDDIIESKLTEFDNQKKVSQIPSGTVIQHYSDVIIKDSENKYVLSEDLKDDYLVCDGSSYTIKFNSNKDERKLFDLFFMIGYTYTEGKSDKDFQNDISELLAYDVIYDWVTKHEDKEKLTVDQVKNMLANAKIPESYIFNLLDFDETDTSQYFTYNNEIYGREVNNFELISNSEKVESFITMLLNCKNVDNCDLFAYSFQVPQMNYTTTTFIGSVKSDVVFAEWKVDENDFIIPHRHFIAVSQGKAHQINDETYTIIFKQYNKNFIDRNTNKKIPYNEDTATYNFRQLTDDRILVAEHCDYDNDMSTTFDIYNDSYILRDIPKTLTTTKKVTTNTMFTRGAKKTTTSKTLYGGFNTLILDEEPNRGLSGDAIYSGEISEDIKMQLNADCFNNNNFFSMENIATLALIKI